MLEFLALENCFDDEVDAGEICRVSRRGDLGEECVGLLLRGLAARERLGSMPSEYALPLFAASMVTSLSTTSKPALAETYAMPAPIMPAPRTPTFLMVDFSMPAGREPPPLIDCRSKKNAWIMFFATRPVTSEVK